MNLKAEQRRLYALLPSDAHCFVRVCGHDSALWVSDLPRKGVECAALPAALYQAGFEIRPDEAARLWYVDWTMERWQQLLKALPAECPALPAGEEYHEIYALCRLWLLHPAAFAPQQLPVLRRVVKLMAQPPAVLLRSVRALHEEAAVQLRQGKPVAHCAGALLAAWLAEHDGEKEGKT